MTDRRSATALLGAVLLLAACGQSADRAAATDQPAPPDQAAPAAAPADTGLAAYVGKYPFDKVDGVAWTDHPAVKAGLAATVTDAQIRKAIESTPGPAAPIEMVADRKSTRLNSSH